MIRTKQKPEKHQPAKSINNIFSIDLLLLATSLSFLAFAPISSSFTIYSSPVISRGQRNDAWLRSTRSGMLRTETSSTSSLLKRSTSTAIKNHRSSSSTTTSTHQSADTKSPPSLHSTDGETPREKAIKIANSFQPGTFNPVPFAANPHVQTILGYVLRKQHPLFTYWGNNNDEVKNIISFMFQSGKKEKEGEDNGCNFWDERKRFETPDGDFFDVDYKYCTPSKSRGIVIQTHGIESSSYSPVSIDMAKAFLDQDVDVACINFRGCSGEPNKTWKSYHLGFTDDLKQLIIATSDTIKKDESLSSSYPIFLSGFSMGSSVILKLLGELGDTARDFNIIGAAVSCAPFDFIKNKKYLEENPFIRKFYVDGIVKSLKQKALAKVEQNLLLNDDGSKVLSSDDPLIDVDGLRACMTQPEFEDAYAAPIFGFEDHLDYYICTSAAFFLEGIEVPTLVVNSADDPFFCPTSFPDDKKDIVRGETPIKLAKTKYGGHLGYMFHQLEMSNETPADEEFGDRDGSVQETKQGQRAPVASWMPMELARFLDHVNTHY